MRFVKHLSHAHADEAMSAILEKHGAVAYGVYWLIVEEIASKMDTDEDEPEAVHSLTKWAEITHTPWQKLRAILASCADHLAVISVSSQDHPPLKKGDEAEMTLGSGRDRVRITVPNILKYRDEHRKKSAHVARTRPPRREEKRVEEKDNTAAAALPTIVDAAAPEPKKAAAAEPPITDAIHFPESQKLIRQAFPGADSGMVTRIIATACRLKPHASDSEVVELLIRTHQGKRQESAALWLNTIPAYLDGKPQERPPPTECPECGGSGKILSHEFDGEPGNAWLDLPEERTHVACPRCRGHTLQKPDEAELELVLVRAKGAS